MKKTAIILMSGGLDSQVAALIALKKTDIKLGLTFDYGQVALRREIEVSRMFCRRHKIFHEVLPLPWLTKLLDTKAVWVPNRNAIFVNIAAAYAEAKRIDFIITGFNAEEAVTFPDNSKKFIKFTNNLFSCSTLSHPKLLAPLKEMNKTEVIKKGLKLGFDPRFFWSCYGGGVRMCGVCESCVKIINAFRKAGVLDVVRDRFNKVPDGI